MSQTKYPHLLDDLEQQKVPFKLKLTDLQAQIRIYWDTEWAKQLDYSYSDSKRWTKFCLPTLDHAIAFKKLIERNSGLSAKAIRSICRLISGKCNLNKYLFEAKMTGSPLCDHCGVIEDIPHYLLRCKKYLNQRRTLYSTYRQIFTNNSVLYINPPTIYSAKSILTADIFPKDDKLTALKATWTFIKATRRHL